MSKKADETLKELIAGILLYCVVIQVILLVRSEGLLTNSCGLWIGGITACGMAIHMKRSIEDALDLGDAGAVSHIRKTFTLRTVIVAIIIGITTYLQIGNLITIFIGVMGLKIAAYIQPHIHIGMKKLRKSK